MDPFRICLALGPLAIYLLVISTINLRRKPTLLSGSSDTACLGIGVIGLIVIGPMELFMPDAAAARFGPYAWFFMIGLYGMVLILSLLTLRPRLVIYNISADELRAVLGDAVERIEPEARWAGDCLSLPKLGVQFYLDATPSMRNVTLTAGGPIQNPSGWKRLEAELAQSLKAIRVGCNYRAIALLAAGLMLATVVAIIIATRHAQLHESAIQMFMI